LTPYSQQLHSEISSPGREILSPRHRWYSNKEGFSPEFVDLVFHSEDANQGILVLDPFCGGGTVPTVATLVGHRTIGIEVNPFMAFLSKAKLIQTKEKILSDYGKIVADGILTAKGISPLCGYSTFTRQDGGKPGLFEADVLNGFEGGWIASQAVPMPCRRLLRLALVGSAMDQCHAVRDGKALRYRQELIDANFTGETLLDSFLSRVEEIKEDLNSSPIFSAQQSIWLGDSRHKLKQLGERRFNICITSPPYLHSFDYSDIYRPELFLGKFVHTTTKLRDVRLNTIRSHLQVKWPRPKRSDFGPLFNDAWREIERRKDSLWDARIPSMVQAYFEDLSQVFSELRKVAAPKASIWMIVSTSAYAGVQIPVDLILADLGEAAGWKLRSLDVVRQLRSSGQHWNSLDSGDVGHGDFLPLRESVIVFGS